MKKKAIFFDRDGTLIVDKPYLNDPDQIEYLPGVFSALKKLQEEGFLLIIVTNQSGISRGLIEINNLNKIHSNMKSEFSRYGVELLGFYYAPYLPSSDHPLRKPNPGMLFEAAKDFNVDLGQSWMIGDRMTDVAAGVRAGTRTILLSDAPVLSKDSTEFIPDGIFSSVRESISFIIKNNTKA